MRESHATITLNEKGLVKLLKEYYGSKGHELFDYQFYQEGERIYADLRIRTEKEDHYADIHFEKLF